MWVILKEPFKSLDYEILAIHLESFNVIVILNLENKFQLAILKYFDAHHSNQSNIHCFFDVFDTHKQTQDFFQELMNALKNGDSIFDLRSRADLNPEKKEKKGGYL